MKRLPLAVAVLALAGCGAAEPEQSPDAFLSALIANLAAGQHDLAWNSLYPPHQEIASRTEYVACERAADDEGRLGRVEILSVREEPWEVAGEDETVDSTAVSFRLTVDGSAAEGTGHLIEVDGRWRWILPPEEYAAYAAGGCP